MRVSEEDWRTRNWSKVEVTTFEEQTKLLPMEEVIRGYIREFYLAALFLRLHAGLRNRGMSTEPEQEVGIRPNVCHALNLCIPGVIKLA